MDAVGVPELVGRPHRVVRCARLVRRFQLVAHEIAHVRQPRLKVVNAAAQKPAVSSVEKGQRRIDAREENDVAVRQALATTQHGGRWIARVRQPEPRPGGSSDVRVRAGGRGPTGIARVRDRAGYGRLAARVDVPGDPEAAAGDRDGSVGHDIPVDVQGAAAGERDRAAARPAAPGLVERRQGRRVAEVVDVAGRRRRQRGARAVGQDARELQLERPVGADHELAALRTHGRHDLSEDGPVGVRARHREGRCAGRSVARSARGSGVETKVGAEARGRGLFRAHVAACLLKLVGGGQTASIHRRLEVAPQRISARAVDGEGRHPDQNREHDRDQDDCLTGLGICPPHPAQYSVLKTAAADITM